MARSSRPRSPDATHAPGAWTLNEGDCLQGLAGLPDKSVDVVITNPPYEAEAHTPDRVVARAGGRLEREPITFPPITEDQRSASARQIARLARRWILVFCQVEAAMKWRAALESGGAVYKRTCQWIKSDGKAPYSGDRPGIGYESIVACHAPGRSTWNGGGSHGVFIVNKSGIRAPATHGDLGAGDRDGDVDQQRDRRETGDEPDDEQGAGDDLDGADERRCEGGRWNADLDEPADAQRVREEELLDALGQEHPPDDHAHEQRGPGRGRAEQLERRTLEEIAAIEIFGRPAQFRDVELALLEAPTDTAAAGAPPRRRRAAGGGGSRARS